MSVDRHRLPTTTRVAAATLTLLALAAVLTGCGGGGGSAAADPSPSAAGTSSVDSKDPVDTEESAGADTPDDGADDGPDDGPDEGPGQDGEDAPNDGSGEAEDDTYGQEDEEVYVINADGVGRVTIGGIAADLATDGLLAEVDDNPTCGGKSYEPTLPAGADVSVHIDGDGAVDLVSVRDESLTTSDGIGVGSSTSEISEIYPSTSDWIDVNGGEGLILDHGATSWLFLVDERRDEVRAVLVGTNVALEGFREAGEILC